MEEVTTLWYFTKLNTMKDEKKDIHLKTNQRIKIVNLIDDWVNRYIRNARKDMRRRFL